MASPDFSPIIKLVYWAAGAVLVIGAISTVVKIRAKRWANERRKRKQAQDRVDVEEMAAAIRTRRKKL
ncbi:MAG: hypothetical protein JWQ72_1895 [Polaromonas sp.]|nr:hypothetical protein [Polaromonas sp.]